MFTPELTPGKPGARDGHLPGLRDKPPRPTSTGGARDHAAKTTRKRCSRSRSRTTSRSRLRFASAGPHPTLLRPSPSSPKGLRGRLGSRFLDPRLPGRSRSGHAPRRGPDTAYPTRSPSTHTQHPLLREGPGDRCVVLTRPRYVARKPSCTEANGHRRRLVLGSGGRVLHLRPIRFDQKPARGLLPHRCGRRRLELRRHEERRRLPQPRLQAPLQGGLLPRAADGSLPGPPVGDGAEPREGRREDRGASPRGRHGRPGRDRHALRHASEDRGQRHEVQVRRQEHALLPADRPVHAEPTSRQRLRMHTHQTWEGQRTCLRGRGRYAGISTCPCSSRADQPLRPPRVREPRRTRTSGWCRATKRRSTSSTRSATAPRVCASRSTRSRQRRSAWNSVARTQQPTRTSRSPRC